MFLLFELLNNNNKYLYSFILKKQGVFLSQNCEFDSHIEFNRCENDNEL